MSEQPRQRRTSPWIVWSAFALLILVLYLASYGPFFWLAKEGKISARTFNSLSDTIYFPIDRAYRNTNFVNENRLGQAYERYLEWWTGPPP